MKILVIFTGGTIGSSVTENGVSTDSSKQYRLLEIYNKQGRSGVQFHTVCPYQELSENNTCKEVFRLAQCVEQNLKKDYDGIIITHGTDTLQYTAAGLGWLFADANIPIVMVSANYILDDERSNGSDNFYYAVEFILGKYGKGVFVSYRNQCRCDGGWRHIIHNAVSVIAHEAYEDNLHSINGEAFGYFHGNDFKKNIDFYSGKKEICSYFSPELFRKILDKNESEIEWSSNVLVIRPYPGMRYPKLNGTVKAVLHETYHSGTICSKSPDIKAFADQARELDIPVYIAGAGAGADYESKRIFDELGFKVMPVASPIAMYMWLWLKTMVNETKTF